MKKKYTVLTPTFGIILFVFIYIFSTTLYSGGSQSDLNSVGFDWINNYWCNLMSEYSMNGKLNPSRTYSIFGLFILCVSLTIFFFQFSRKLVNNKTWKNIIKISGTFSMVFSFLIFTSYHDIMTIISSVFGVLVVIGIIRSVYLSDFSKFKITGLICILSLLLNNLIYYSGVFIEFLPLLQKITFLIVLLWIVGLNIKMFIDEN